MACLKRSNQKLKLKYAGIDVSNEGSREMVMVVVHFYVAINKCFDKYHEKFGYSG